MQTVNELEEVKFGFNEKVVVYPQLLSSAEEDAFTKRFQDISDADISGKSKKEFEIIKQFLIDVSAKMPEVIVLEKDVPTKKPLFEGAETIADAVHKYFAEFNEANFRTASALYWNCKARFQPSANF